MPDDDDLLPQLTRRPDVILVAAPDVPSALRAALVGARSTPELPVIDRPKAVEPEEPIDVVLPVAVIRTPVGRGSRRRRR